MVAQGNVPGYNRDPFIHEIHSFMFKEAGQVHPYFLSHTSKSGDCNKSKDRELFNSEYA